MMEATADKGISKENKFSSENKFALTDKNELTIGRSPSSDIHLSNGKVSDDHAILRKCTDGWLLTDNGSANGTRVNGVNVCTTALRSGDTIQVGEWELIYNTETLIIVTRPAD